jgi:SAM-dependent methyltransferase
VQDRERWNRRYRERDHSSFRVHPLVERVLEYGLPAGPVADLACGASGSALRLAEAGRRVLAVDIADSALALLDGEARRRGLRALVRPVQADLADWWPAEQPTEQPRRRQFALVLCTGFWERDVFGAAVRMVTPGGLIAWEAYTTGILADRPSFPERWCLRDGEPATLLPPGFTLLEQQELPGRRRQLIARNGELNLRT